jgi:hypothetical protein
MPDNDLTSSKRYAIGLKYKMDVALTQLVPRDGSGGAVVNDKSFIDYVGIQYVDSGAFKVVLMDKILDRNREYPIRSDRGRKLGDRIDDTTDVVLIESGTRQVTARGRTQDIVIHVVNDGNIDSRIATISQHSTIVPK